MTVSNLKDAARSDEPTEKIGQPGQCLNQMGECLTK